MLTHDIIRMAGGPTKVARKLELHHTTVIKWDKVPAPHARAVAELAGVHPFDVRPDIYDPPTAVASAA